MLSETFFKITLANVYEEGNAFNMLFRPLGYAQCVLVRNSECKQICLFTRKRHMAPLNAQLYHLLKDLRLHADSQEVNSFEIQPVARHNYN